MTTISDAWQAGIDAVVADNTLNRAGFVDALQTVITQRFSNAEGNAWCDAVATEFNRLGLINQPTYNRLRAHIIADPVIHRSLFDALQATISTMPETLVAVTSLRIINLRADRDEVNTSISTLQGFKTGQTQQVRDSLDAGIAALRQQRENIREALRGLIGDPDG